MHVPCSILSYSTIVDMALVIFNSILSDLESGLNGGTDCERLLAHGHFDQAHNGPPVDCVF